MKANNCRPPAIRGHIMKEYSEMTRYELAAARTQVWRDGDDPVEQAKIEKAFRALDRQSRQERTVRRSLRKKYGSAVI
jgi:predicted DNA-binding protein